MKKYLWITIALSLFFTACLGRVPSNTSTASMTKGYFKKYGNKYKDTVFSESPVSSIEVKAVKELQKDVATSLAVVKLENGTEIPIISTMIRKPPLGWRMTSWEWVHE